MPEPTGIPSRARRRGLTAALGLAICLILGITVWTQIGGSQVDTLHSESSETSVLTGETGLLPWPNVSDGGAEGWYEGEVNLQLSLARSVDGYLLEPLEDYDFGTGSDFFDGEWLYGTYFMAGMGYGQLAQSHPELRGPALQRMEICIEQLLTEETKAFDLYVWSEDPLINLGRDGGHAAYLGYLNLLIGFHRSLDSNSRFSMLNDQISAGLMEGFEGQSIGFIETYPGEIFPVDNAAVIGSLGLYCRNTGECPDHWLPTRLEEFSWLAVDPTTGLLFQRLSPYDGEPLDYPRGSGSALGAYFLSFADLSLSAQIYASIQEHLIGQFAGLTAVREYPTWVEDGRGDIDSGPIILGFGLSATGFTISVSRIHQDRETFDALIQCAHLFGLPRQRDDRLEFLVGGPLEHAILLAMFTAGMD